MPSHSLIGPLTLTISQWSEDISFKDDVTAVIFFGVSFMGSTHGYGHEKGLAVGSATPKGLPGKLS